MIPSLPLESIGVCGVGGVFGVRTDIFIHKDSNFGEQQFLNFSFFEMNITFPYTLTCDSENNDHIVFESQKRFQTI